MEQLNIVVVFHANFLEFEYRLDLSMHHANLIFVVDIIRKNGS